MYSLCIAIHVKIVNMVLIGVMHRQVRHTCTVVHKRQTSLSKFNSVNSVNIESQKHKNSVRPSALRPVFLPRAT